MPDEGKGGICNAVRRRGYCYGYKHHMPIASHHIIRCRTIGKYPSWEEGEEIRMALGRVN